MIDQSKYRDSVLDQDGSLYLLSGQDPVEGFGRSVVFQRFDQMLWRPDPESQRGLTAFGVAVQGTGRRRGCRAAISRPTRRFWNSITAFSFRPRRG